MDRKEPPPPYNHAPLGFEQPAGPHDRHYPPPQQFVVAPAPVPTNYGPAPQQLTCPHCHSNIQTNIVTENATKTHLFALLLCCCLCWPCAWAPYCMDSCKNKNHYCPDCGAYLGTYDK